MRSERRQRVCLADRQEPDCTIAVVFVNRTVSLTSQTTATSVFLQVALALNVAVDVAASCVAGGKSETAAMQVLRDSRHRPYCTVGVFFVPSFFLCLHQQRQRPVFLQLALTIDRYVLLHTLA